MKKLSILFLTILLLSTSTVFAQVQDLMTENREQIEKQIEGNFAQMQKDTTPVGGIQDVWDNASELAGMRSVVYNPSSIIKIQLRTNMTTTIVLPYWEKITQWTIGLDGSIIKVQTLNDNIVSLQPFVVGIDTNFTIIGDSGTVYMFYVRSEGNNSKNITDQKLRILYAQPEEFKQQALDKETHIFEKIKDDFLDSAEKTWLRENKFKIDNIRHDRTMYGEEQIAPFAIFRDNKFTFIDWGKNHEEKPLPVVYQVINGVNNPVSTTKTKDGRFLIVESVNDLALIYGEDVVCIKKIEETK